MRNSLRWLYVWPVPEQLAIGKVKEAFDDDGNLVNDDTKERLENLVKSVLETSKNSLSRCDFCQNRALKINLVVRIY